MARTKITIYYDNQQNFFVETIVGYDAILPDELISFNDRQRKTLADAFPNLGEQIMSGRENIHTKAAVKAYNDQKRVAMSVRYYKASNGKLISIECLPKVLNEGISYEGEPTAGEIFDKIAELTKEHFSQTYVIFECNTCGKQYGIMRKKIITCKCGAKYDSQEVYIKRKFESENSFDNEVNAIACLAAWRREDGGYKEDEVAVEHTTFYFDATYYPNYNDSQNLHKKLYEACAYEEVFVIDGHGVKFSKDYKNYIKGLKNEKGKAQLYNELVAIENRINSTSYALLPIEKAFYWYIKSYWLTGEKKLVWNIDKEVQVFDNLDGFIQAFLDADYPTSRQLIDIFVAVADLQLENDIFAGYRASAIDLSYAIFKNTRRFVYITDDAIVDFGTTFIDDLHNYDEFVEDRNAFLASIREHESFWNDVKGEKFDELYDYYDGSVDGSYYDRLCYYQYAILGKTMFRYKDLDICDSKLGYKYIKKLIVDRYLGQDEDVITLYAQLVELMHNDIMWGNPCWFAGLRGVVSDSLTFDKLREMIIHDGDMPSLPLYLACTSKSSDEVSSIKFWHENRCDSLTGHIMRLLKSYNVINAVGRFFNNPEVLTIVKYIFDRRKKGGWQKFLKDQEEAFNLLLQCSGKLESQISEKEQSIIMSEISGNSSSIKPTTRR